MENVVQILNQWIVTYGLNVIGAIVILIVGRVAAGIMRNVTKRGLSRGNVDETLTLFFSRLVFIGVLVFAVLAALARFGVETASFVVVLGAVGFAFGFALQGSLSNFAAGVMLLVFRPFKIGEYVEVAGVAGSVKEIDLFTTTLATPDNVKIIVGNGSIFGSTIKNYSAYPTRRCDLAIGIGYTSDIEKALSVMDDLIQADTRVLKEPVHQLAVSELADSSVNFVVRMWCAKEDYWALKFDMTRAIKEAFDKEGIEIPFPQRTVHLIEEA
jgi:small conductance mechanosensitive channel